MIISASRRTDIPAFYSQWLINRIAAGYCAVPNPFNRKQISYISLSPEDVDAIVFWTRNPKPLLAHLQELDGRGLNYYFLFTLVNNPGEIDPYSPEVDKALAVFQELADKIGPERVIWRYDPIILGNITPASYHLDNFGRIAGKLAGYTKRCFISFVDFYRKASRRIDELKQKNITVNHSGNIRFRDVEPLVAELMRMAGSHDIRLLSCAEKMNLESLGVSPGKCIDDDLIRKVFKVDVSARKDPSQRKECGCAVSRDIGMYDSCLFGCSYCYATSSFNVAQRNYSEHDPTSPSLLGRYDAKPSVKKVKTDKACTVASKQLKLF
ncbi:DUF1848 domain-containing protein [Desulfosediminicola sp.]|uniref:DUF1848 domain-containing protein n=1 Tax=Desulfosediminicola sp. TaxID=2886825 RepID=UPI003AF2AA9E